MYFFKAVTYLTMRAILIKWNIREKLLMVVVVGILVAFSFAGSFRIYQAKQKLQDEISHSGNERATLIAESVANLIVAYDYGNLESLADRIVKFQDVQELNILNRLDKIMVNRKSVDFNTKDQTQVFTAPVIFAGETIGKVELVISFDRLSDEIYKTYRNVIVFICIFATLTCVFLYTAVSSFIVKPLSRLSEAADQLAMGNFSAALPAETADEFGHMVRAFSSMRESRKQVELELNSLNASLETIVMARVAELHESEAYIHAVLDNVNEGIIVIEENGIINSFNPAAEKIFGYTEQEIINQNFRLLVSADDTELTGKHLLYSESADKNFLFGITREVIGMRKDYSAFPLELKTSKIQIQNRILFIRTARDISERKEAEQRIRYMASHDALTKLPNRTLLQDRIEQVLVQNRRRKQQAAILFIDLDKFKIINDTLGHDFGDGVLIEVSNRLTAQVRSEDTVARQGGDEFIILLSNISNPENTGLIAQKIMDSLTMPFLIDGKELHIGASIGIALFPEDGEDMVTLLKNSDIAMYHAKEYGRGNFQFFSEKMNAQAAENQSMSIDLRYAVERNELFLVYQPVVDMVSGEIAGMEVLLRWQHPVEGLISPVKFIPLAEETGLILPIGDWVFRTACAQLHEWQLQGYEVPRLAINLSAKQFRESALADTISSILKENSVDARHIGIEITESMLVHNIEEVVETLGKLSKMGLEISIDDFGTGYSSLSYLKRFPIDKLKIDKTFVDDIATHPDDAAIIKAIIAMAHGLSMKVVTEGVETAAQLAFLRLHGCEQYQGYLYSKPLPVADITLKLKRKNSPV